MTFKKWLESEGYTPHSHLIHGIYTPECLGIDVEDTDEMWDIAFRLGQSLYRDALDDIGSPWIDPSVGAGYVFYWPDILWEDE